MKTQELIPADSSADVTTTGAFELGRFTGHHQAFAFTGSQCSVADAHALREIRDRKLYRLLKLTWEEFLIRYCGITPKTAEHIISRLTEFGDTYFHLAQVVNITTPEYRALAPAIEDNTVEHDGQRIPINRENAEQLVAAVRDLRAKLQKSKQQLEGPPFAAIDRRLNRCCGELWGAIRRGLDDDSRKAMRDIVESMIERLQDYQPHI